VSATWRTLYRVSLTSLNVTQGGAQYMGRTAHWSDYRSYRGPSRSPGRTVRARRRLRERRLEG
jgi:hypothetical protein